MKNSKEFYESVTNNIIDYYNKNNRLPWVRPWSNSNSGFNISFTTKKEYQGINQIILMMSPYESNKWNTFNNWKNLGFHLKKKSKGTPICYFQMNKVVDKKTDEESFYPMLKKYYVYNAEQIENNSTLIDKPKPKNKILPIDEIDSYVKNTNAKIVEHVTNEAFYRPFTDSIHISNINQFKSSYDYYATLLHELTHWTMHESRCNRKSSNRFKSVGYAYEELIAEIGSTFLCNQFKMDSASHTHLQNHVNYISSWLQALKDDPKFIFKAAAESQKAVNFLNSFQQIVKAA